MICFGAAFRSALDAPLRMAGPDQVAPHRNFERHLVTSLDGCLDWQRHKGCLAAIAHSRYWHEAAVLCRRMSVVGEKAVMQRTSPQRPILTQHPVIRSIHSPYRP